MQNQAEITAILEEFHRISGFRISLHDTEYHEICAYPSQNSPFCRKVQEVDSIYKTCLENDYNAFLQVKSTDSAYVYKCHCGLYEAVAPIYHFGVLSGYLMMGQICDTEKDAHYPMRQSLREACANEEETEAMIHQIHAIDRDLISSYVNIMKIIAEHITNTGKVGPGGENLAEIVKRYICKNFTSKISLSHLSEKYGRSHSTLMKHFKNTYGVTIAEYTNRVRLEHAAKLLQTSSKSIKEVSVESGFADQNYFSRQFAAHYNCSPSQYRKSRKISG